MKIEQVLELTTHIRELFDDKVISIQVTKELRDQLLSIMGDVYGYTRPPHSVIQIDGITFWSER